MTKTKVPFNKVTREMVNDFLTVLYDEIEKNVDLTEEELELIVYGPVEHALDLVFGCPDYSNYN